MVLMRFREVVREGHVKDYKAACKAWNEVAISLGLAPFRYFSSGWGERNEFFGEAEYEDSADIDRRFAAARSANEPKLEAAAQAIREHIVDGRSHDWILSEEPLG